MVLIHISISEAHLPSDKALLNIQHRDKGWNIQYKINSLDILPLEYIYFLGHDKYYSTLLSSIEEIKLAKSYNKAALSKSKFSVKRTQLG